MNDNIKQIFPNNVKTRIAYTGRKLGTKFHIKDLTENQYGYDLIYYRKYPEPNFHENYLGETEIRMIERAVDHSVKDKQSHLPKHALTSNEL